LLSLAGRELKHTLNFLLHYLWFGLQHVKLTPRTLTTETDKQKIAASRREAIVPHAENLPRKSKLILVTLCVRESCLARFALNRCSITDQVLVLRSASRLSQPRLHAIRARLFRGR
jgi:hypothetical protein